MKQHEKSKHIPPEHQLNEELENLFSDGKPLYNKSNLAIWEDLDAVIQTKKPEAVVVKMQWFRYAAAAAVLLLVTMSVLVRYYSVSVTNPKGQHLAVVLPDHSQVTLNAASTLNYHPYWFWYSRSLNFEGEGFFEVKKGSRFSVHSTNGSTEVLGTSFNINTRKNNYEVLCQTGKVKVNHEKESLLLKPNEMGVYKSGKSLIKLEARNSLAITAWLNNKFYFEDTPLSEVFYQLELQYDINIQCNKDFAEIKYNGFFNKTASADTVLSYVANGTGLRFQFQSPGNYLVTR